MQKKITIKQIVLAGLFLAVASVFVVIQIPIPPFLSLEFSLVVILIARRHIGLFFSIVITCIYPWFALVTPWVFSEPIGILALILTGITALCFDALFVKGDLFKKDIFSSFVSILLVTITMTILNMILIVPAYYAFDWSLVGNNNVWWYIGTISAIFIPFNFTKMLIIYILELPLLYKLKKVL